jgi:hypothetical protein
MAALHPGEKHGPLRDEPWSEGKVRAGIAAIVRDVVSTYQPGFDRLEPADARVGPIGAWPTHPLDGDEPYGTSFYRSAGGVFWSVSFLARAGVVEEPAGWFSEQLPELIRRNQVDRTNFTPDLDPTRSFLFGDVPLRMLQYLHQPTPEQVERARELFGQGRYTLWTGDLGVALFLHECLRANGRFPSVDVF